MKKENMIFRLKMEIASLVNEMISKLPDTLFLSDSTTFLDPSMASGQYVAAIEQRLRKHGHSDENIKGRVFGVEKNMLRVNYAIKKNKLVGTYSVDKNDVPSILICNMKFDCIVGNPPYQNGPKGSSGKLWMDFVNTSVNSLRNGGYLCFVHPITWRSIGSKLWRDIYQKYQVEYAKIEPTISWSAGVKVDWYILHNVPYTSPTKVEFQTGQRFIDFREVLGLTNSTIVDKFIKYSSKLEVEQTHEFDTRRSFMSETRKDVFTFPIKHTGASELRWSSKEHPWQKKNKILLSRSGYLKPEYDNGKTGTTQDCFAIFVSSKTESDYIIQLLNSKLYKFVQSNTKTSGFNDIKTLNLLPYPKGLSDNFTNADLYAHFKLTDDEIKLVESTIKD